MRWESSMGAAALAVLFGGCQETARPEPDAGPPVAETASGSAGVEAAALRLCDAGDDRACDKLTAMYLSGKGVAQSDAKAAELSRRLCETGRRYFCPSFALALYEGRGIAADQERAVALFRDTCKDDPVACSEFGNLYANGLGVARNPELAAMLLDLACQHGDARACSELGER